MTLSYQGSKMSGLLEREREETTAYLLTCMQHVKVNLHAKQESMNRKVDGNIRREKEKKKKRRKKKKERKEEEEEKKKTVKEMHIPKQKPPFFSECGSNEISY